MVVDFLFLGLDTVQNGDGAVGHTVIVTPHQRCIIGIGADDGNTFLILLQWQHVVLVL